MAEKRIWHSYTLGKGRDCLVAAFLYLQGSHFIPAGPNPAFLHQYEMTHISRKSEKIYVPYAMLAGLLLDNNVFADVSVSEGKPDELTDAAPLCSLTA